MRKSKLLKFHFLPANHKCKRIPRVPPVDTRGTCQTRILGRHACDHMCAKRHKNNRCHVKCHYVRILRILLLLATDGCILCCASWSRCQENLMKVQIQPLMIHRESFVTVLYITPLDLRQVVHARLRVVAHALSTRFRLVAKVARSYSSSIHYLFTPRLFRRENLVAELAGALSRTIYRALRRIQGNILSSTFTAAVRKC